MVQRKATPKLNPQPQPQPRRNHVKLERQPSSSHQKEYTRSNGAGDLKKKMKLERSMRAVIDLPNYMKPTSSWDKKKQRVQVTTLQPSDSKNMKKVRPLVKKSLSGAGFNRPTCSSTLKDSKFPKTLDLNHGGTEAEGTSVVKVCPYTYCSLNGHGHADLAPLKCIVSAKRKLIKAQRSMKPKALSSFRIKCLGKNKEGIDTGQNVCVEISHDDIFVKIYYTSKLQEQITNEIKAHRYGQEDDQMKEEFANAGVSDDKDQNSEFSNEEIDAMVSFLEYSECDQQVENNEVEKTPSLVPEDYEESRLEFYVVDELNKDGEEMVQNENKASIINSEGKQETNSPFPDIIEDDGVLNSDVNEEEEEANDALSPPEVLSTEPTIAQDCVVDGGNLKGNIEEEDLHGVYIFYQTSEAQELDSLEENNQDKANFQVSEGVVSGQRGQNDLEELNNVLNESIKAEDTENEVVDTGYLNTVHLIDAVQVNKEEEDDHLENQEDAQEFKCNNENDDASIAMLKARLRITGKKIPDEWEAIREFNPRSPRFLDREPDPEAETVDLRHQMMDERKNSEEWMLDYALQRAVTKLAPARKKKVALLVEAFETVIPVPSSGFLSGRFMQACS